MESVFCDEDNFQWLKTRRNVLLALVVELDKDKRLIHKLALCIEL
jgi:hypothetical protein